MPTEAEKFSACMEAIKDSQASIAQIAAPKALIIKRFLVDMAPGTDLWPGMLKSDLDLDDNGDPQIHAIQIWYEGLDNDKTNEPIISVDPIVNFGYAFCVKYWEGSDADNSEKRLMKEVSEVYWALAVASDLNMRSADDPIVRSCVSHHRGLSIPRMSIKPTSLGPVQIASGGMEVVMQSRQLR